MFMETVARLAVGASAVGLLVTGLAVLAAELVSKRPAPLERARGLLAAVNFVGILGFAGFGLPSAVWGFGRLGYVPGPAVTAIQALGVACLVAAGLLAAWGLRSMGRQMSSQAEVRPDTELIIGGAFGVVRHPLYVSILLLWAGGTLALLSWLLALCTLVLVPLFVARSRLEEEILIRHFGAAYSSYAARVPMLIPRRCATAEARERPSDASAPQTIATASWGFLLIWIGAALLLHWSWGVGLVGAGVIVLGAQAARWCSRVRLEGLSIAAGVVSLISGLADLSKVTVDFFPVLFIVAGIALLVSIWAARRRHAAGGPPDAEAHPRPRG